ncbi:MAG: DUF4058 family protein [Gemmataceae bacterium]|nr:DUF4058 family protein [Gemmataceae bacterium]
MPLRDHFRSPVNDKHHWSELHGQWPGEIVRTLFDPLPPGFVAGPRVYLGSSFEVDVSVTEDDRDPDGPGGEGEGGTATLAAGAPTLTVTADLSDQDEYEVRVYDAERERRLVAAVEIVSPSNKGRPDTREPFVGKVAALLRQDVCVAVVDVVSVRQANLYAELLARLGRADPRLGDPPPALYAVTLSRRKPPRRRPLLDAWFFPMAVGEPLPTVPLWLSPDLRIELPLEPGYQEACRLLRIA